MNTPVLFIVFNRPDSSAIVFEAIRKAAPPRLYIASDGARTGKKNDAPLIDECRKLVEKVDWQCEVHTLFREENLGCGLNISGALDWFFDHEEMGIILEDDCVPDHSFFGYCEELLDKYKFENQVMHIGGVNFQDGKIWGDGDYFFNTIQHCWGWASWRRAWKLYDYNMKDFNSFKNSKLANHISNKPSVRKWWIKNLESSVNKGYFTFWSIQWTYCIWKNKGLAINPNINLVSNIGYGAEATHTKWDDFMSNCPTQSISLPLKHPKKIKLNRGSELVFYTKYSAYKPVSTEQRISKFADFLNPKKNNFSIKLYNLLFKPILVKLGLKGN